MIEIREPPSANNIFFSGYFWRREEPCLAAEEISLTRDASERGEIILLKASFPAGEIKACSVRDFPKNEFLEKLSCAFSAEAEDLM